MLRKVFLSLSAIGVALTCGFSYSQSYPAKPVRMLVAFPTGGSADIVARLLAQRLSEQVGVNFFVENRPGAGGNLAFGALAKAEPDGYTILNSTPGIVINPHLYRKVDFRIEDFVAISHVGEAPLLVMAHPSSPGEFAIGAREARPSEAGQRALRERGQRQLVASGERSDAHDGRHRSRARAL